MRFRSQHHQQGPVFRVQARVQVRLRLRVRVRVRIVLACQAQAQHAPPAGSRDLVATAPQMAPQPKLGRESGSRVVFQVESVGSTGLALVYWGRGR